MTVVYYFTARRRLSFIRNEMRAHTSGQTGKASQIISVNHGAGLLQLSESQPETEPLLCSIWKSGNGSEETLIFFKSTAVFKHRAQFHQITRSSYDVLCMHSDHWYCSYYYCLVAFIYNFIDKRSFLSDASLYHESTKHAEWFAD